MASLLVFARATPVGAADGDEVYFGAVEIPQGNVVEGNVAVIGGDLVVGGMNEGDIARVAQKTTAAARAPRATGRSRW